MKTNKIKRTKITDKVRRRRKMMVIRRKRKVIMRKRRRKMRKRRSSKRRRRSRKRRKRWYQSPILSRVEAWSARTNHVICHVFLSKCNLPAKPIRNLHIKINVLKCFFSFQHFTCSNSRRKYSLWKYSLIDMIFSRPLAPKVYSLCTTYVSKVFKYL